MAKNPTPIRLTKVLRDVWGSQCPLAGASEAELIREFSEMVRHTDMDVCFVVVKEGCSGVKCKVLCEGCQATRN